MKQIEHFMLPKVSEDLFINEAKSSISLTKEVATKINELIEAYNELMKNESAKYNEQDGRIRQGILYMKDNLANTINELLEIMKNNGEIDTLIVDSVNETITEIRETLFPVGHIKRYGAYGDGAHNDTTALSNACTEARIKGTKLIIPDGIYLISGDIDMRYLNVECTGEIKASGDHVVTIGSTSASTNGIKVNIKRAKNIKVLGVKNSLINIDYCEKLHLFADGDDSTASSIAYTQFYGAYAKEIIIDSTGTGENIGWINENLFRIKRVEHISMDGNYGHNNNHFEHINLERGVLDLINCRNNYISARCEGGVTINNGAEVNHNFIEKEYYYKHYFGENVTENQKGVISYYPVNKLQTERQLLHIDRYNKHYPVTALEFNANGYFNGNSYNAIYHSNLIKLDKSFSLKMKSNVAAFRVELNFYDENKNKIITEVDNFSDGKMKFNGEGANALYSIASNVSDDTVNFYPGVAKYVEYKVIFGNSVENINVEYVTVKLLKLINTDVYVTDTLVHDVYTQVPTSGYFEQGQILYGKNPIPGASVGIVCTQSGTPGVWNNFGSIAS